MISTEQQPPALPGEMWRHVEVTNGWLQAYAVTTGEHGPRAWACYGLTTAPIDWCEEFYSDAGSIFRRWALAETARADAAEAAEGEAALALVARHCDARMWGRQFAAKHAEVLTLAAEHATCHGTCSCHEAC